MKKIYFLFCLLTSFSISAQMDINFDATSFSTGLGYMNVFDNPQNGTIGGFQFGSGWGLADLNSTFDTGANTATLTPNRITDTNIYWQTAGVLEGNKIMEANLYLEDDTLLGNIINFHGNVQGSTLDGSSLSIDYAHVAFIKVYASDYSSVLASNFYDLGTTGDFTLSLDASAYSTGEHVQYGFTVTGPNINSDAAFDTDYANLGSIVIGPNTTLSVNQNEISSFNIYPNPSNAIWNVRTNNQTINTIYVFDVLGKQVVLLNPNSNTVSIDASDLPQGLYFAKIQTESGIKSVKLIKE